jgi:hypothetical protein
MTNSDTLMKDFHETTWLKIIKKMKEQATMKYESLHQSIPIFYLSSTKFSLLYTLVQEALMIMILSFLLPSSSKLWYCDKNYSLVQLKHQEVKSATSQSRKRGANGMTAAEERKENKKTMMNDSCIAALATTAAYVNNNELNNLTREKRSFHDYKTRQNSAAALHQLLNPPLENNM